MKYFICLLSSSSLLILIFVLEGWLLRQSEARRGADPPVHRREAHPAAD